MIREARERGSKAAYADTLTAWTVATPRTTDKPSTATCDLSVAIVSYRSLELLERCLATWKEAVAGMSAELHVVENGTGDPLAARVHRQVPDAQVTFLPRSVGFGTAVNLGLRHARGRHVALLNPDTLLLPDALARLVAHLDEHPDVGVVGPRVWDDAERTSIQRSWRRFPSLATSLFSRHSLASWLWPKNPWTRAYLNHDCPPNEVQDTDWLSGCCLVVRGELFRRLGGLDERYPLFCEDVDLCRSSAALGMRVVYEPRAEIVHLVGGSRRHARLRSTWLRHRSMMHYVLKFQRRAHPGTWLLVGGIWCRFAMQLFARETRQ